MAPGMAPPNRRTFGCAARHRARHPSRSARTWLFVSTRKDPVRGVETARPGLRAAELRAELELRLYAVTRSEQEQRDGERVPLPRSRLSTPLVLPVGSEPGGYEVQVVDSELPSRASACADAEIRKRITTLQTTIDLRCLPPSAYQLELRRHGEETIGR
jgi:hypothetical protein